MMCMLSYFRWQHTYTTGVQQLADTTTLNALLWPDFPYYVISTRKALTCMLFRPTPSKHHWLSLVPLSCTWFFDDWHKGLQNAGLLHFMVLAPKPVPTSHTHSISSRALVPFWFTVYCTIWFIVLSSVVLSWWPVFSFHSSSNMVCSIAAFHYSLRISSLLTVFYEYLCQGSLPYSKVGSDNHHKMQPFFFLFVFTSRMMRWA
jgi:hypothetical protein